MTRLNGPRGPIPSRPRCDLKTILLDWGWTKSMRELFWFILDDESPPLIPGGSQKKLGGAISAGRAMRAEVLRLTTNSNLVGTTGRSPGFSPFRMPLR